MNSILILVVSLVGAVVAVLYILGIMNELREGTVDTPRHISPGESIKIGIVVTTMTILTLGGMFIMLGMPMFVNISAVILIAGGILATVGYDGLRKVPVGEQGVLLWLGNRVETCLLMEGWHWVFPYNIMDVISVSTREEIFEMPVFDVKAIGSLTLATAEPLKIDRNALVVEMLVKGSIRYRIHNPYQYLNIGNDSSLESSETTARTVMKERFESLFRVEATDKNDLDLIKERSNLAEGMLEEMVELAKSLGIEIKAVMVPEVKHKNPQVAQMYDKLLKEVIEQKSEGTDADTLINLTKKVQEALGIDNAAAARLVLIMQGKVISKEQVIRSEGNPMTDISSAAALVAASFGGKQPGGSMGAKTGGES